MPHQSPLADPDQGAVGVFSPRGPKMANEANKQYSLKTILKQKIVNCFNCTDVAICAKWFVKSALIFGHCNALVIRA
jgi:hypothetical protein